MSRPKFTPLNILVAAVGAILLVYTVRRVGWADVLTGITSVGWWFALVVILGASRMAFRALAWIECANPFDSTGFASEASLAQGKPGSGALTFSQAFGAILAADAVGNLTPLGLLASEPTKILMTRARITTVTSVASVAIENAFYIASVGLVLLTGTWLFFQRAAVPPGLQLIAQAIVISAIVMGIVSLWAARSQPAILSRLAPFITKLAGRSAVPVDAVREIESRIYGVLQWPIGRIARTLAWETAFHVAAVAEVWLVLRLLPGGEQITLVDAFLMESTGRFVIIAFKFVPYRLGIDEAGSGAVAQVLGLNPVTGVTLALVRRLRIIFLNVFGLIRLAKP